MVALMKPTYTAVCERAERWWAIRIEELPGVFTQVRRLDQAEAMARDAIAQMLGVPGTTFEVDVEPVVPADLRQLVAEARTARSRSEQASGAAARATRVAAAELVRRGLTLREAGVLLGLSHQRIAQLVG